MVDKSDTQNESLPEIPVVKFTTKVSEKDIYLTPIPLVCDKGKRLYLQMQKTIIIEPGEAKILDLRIKIIIPSYKNTPMFIGRLVVNERTLKIV